MPLVTRFSHSSCAGSSGNGKPIIIANCITLLLAGYILAMKLRNLRRSST